MILAGKTLVSDSVFSEQFVCDLEACKGGCCVKGDSGAPLDKNEARLLENAWNEIRSYLPERGIAAIEAQGKWVKEKDGDFATPLVENKECAYTVFENGIAKCGIEKAFEAGKINFRKPVSCHLYPVRIKNIGEFEALNYEEWSICKPACTLGKQLGVPVFRFVKDAIIRKFGQDYYDELEKIYEDLKHR